jgi:hypothetical protein
MEYSRLGCHSGADFVIMMARAAYSSFKGETKMTDLRQNQRVLGRAGARELSQDELSLIYGSDGGRPTSTLSRDPNGIPRDITQD